VVPGSNNFQFEKAIPHSKEFMRIEFMAPEEFKRPKDFRVDVDEDVHARSCTGGNIAVAESSLQPLAGKLPDGSLFETCVRVTEPHALVMLKLLALDDRYHNIRGKGQHAHDREEARTHSADIIAVVSARPDLKEFKAKFENQFRRDPGLGMRVLRIEDQYFRENSSPGFLVYEEWIVADRPLDRGERQRVRAEIDRAHQMMLNIIPTREFYELASAVEDCTNADQSRLLVEEFLANLHRTRTKITDRLALELVPAEALGGGAYAKKDTFLTSTSEALKRLTDMERSLLMSHLESCARVLHQIPELMDRFASILS
jgi:hypothetical protein